MAYVLKFTGGEGESEKLAKGFVALVISRLLLSLLPSKAHERVSTQLA
jgi:hypothetical protein